MKNIVVSMQNTLLSEAIAHALTETRPFVGRARVLPGRTGDALSLCAAMPADILLMEVSRLSAYTLENRLSLIDRLSAKVPGCKTALLCDENSDPELARRVRLRPAGSPHRCISLCLRDPRLSGRRDGRAVRKGTTP